MQSADAIIIGTGQGGVPLAEKLADRGQRVVLFERGPVGGTCVNTGCTPSKTLLASAHAAGRARLAAGIGVHAEVRVDFAAVMRRVRAVRDEFRSGNERRLDRAGIRLVRAEARFTGMRRVQGGPLEVEAPLVVIDTGGSPVVPDLPGLEHTRFLTDRTVFDLAALPERLIVLGGGYVGLELGQGFRRLGSEVAVIAGGERVLEREAPEVSGVLARALERDGVELVLGPRGTAVRREDGAVRVELEDGRAVSGDALLVAVGRTPNTRALNLASAGVETDERGYVRVDEKLRTSAEGVFAIGDVAGQPPFTHVSWEDHRRVLDALDGGTRTRGDRTLAYAVFTDPQVARAGLSLDAARERGHRARAARRDLDSVARGIETGETLGFYEMVADEDTGRILGATLVGPEAAEVVHVFLTLLEAGATWRDLERQVHVHPAFAEALPGLAREFAG